MRGISLSRAGSRAARDQSVPDSPRKRHWLLFASFASSREKEITWSLAHVPVASVISVPQWLIDAGRSRDKLTAVLPTVLDLINKHWGFTSLRPIQQQAIGAVLERRDSLVVMPTGGGKSLCYQAPALIDERPTVVVSPLISLMKDQVDGLRECGVAAAPLNNAQQSDEHRVIAPELLAGRIKLLFVSPERLALPSFRDLLQPRRVRTLA